jgi:uracil-DNA glycosylase
MPEDLAAEGIDLMELAFTECSWHLEREVQLLQPRLVISLSQRVLHLLSKRYLNIMLGKKAM